LGAIVLNKKQSCKRNIHGGIVKIRQGFITVIAVLLAQHSMALSLSSPVGETQSQDCNKLIIQLQMMTSAQKSLLDSMLRKNEMLASTLDLYADDFQNRGQKIKRGDLASLRNSANAFRKHEIREQSLINKFEAQASKLIAKTNQCLDESRKSSELRQSLDLRLSR
jgi:hypothetical protein